MKSFQCAEKAKNVVSSTRTSVISTISPMKARRNNSMKNCIGTPSTGTSGGTRKKSSSKFDRKKDERDRERGTKSQSQKQNQNQSTKRTGTTENMASPTRSNADQNGYPLDNSLLDDDEEDDNGFILPATGTGTSAGILGTHTPIEQPYHDKANDRPLDRHHYHHRVSDDATKVRGGNDADGDGDGVTLKELLQKPIQSCQQRFGEEPPIRFENLRHCVRKSNVGAGNGITKDAKRVKDSGLVDAAATSDHNGRHTANSDINTNEDNDIYESESDHQFLTNGSSSSFRQQDLADVFRRSPKKSRNAQGHGRGNEHEYEHGRPSSVSTPAQNSKRDRGGRSSSAAGSSNAQFKVGSDRGVGGEYAESNSNSYDNDNGNEWKSNPNGYNWDQRDNNGKVENNPAIDSVKKSIRFPDAIDMEFNPLPDGTPGLNKYASTTTSTSHGPQHHERNQHSHNHNHNSHLNNTASTNLNDPWREMRVSNSGSKVAAGVGSAPSRNGASSNLTSVDRESFVHLSRLNPNPKDRTKRRSRSPVRSHITSTGTKIGTTKDLPLDQQQQQYQQRRPKSQSPKREHLSSSNRSKRYAKHDKAPRTPGRESTTSINLLDVSMEETETRTDVQTDTSTPSSSASTYKAFSDLKEPGSNRTAATARMTPSTPSTGTTQFADDLNYDETLLLGMDTITNSEVSNSKNLHDVRLTLFEKDQDRLDHEQAVKKDRQDTNMEEIRHEKELLQHQVQQMEQEWKKSQLQIKRMLAEEVVEWFRNEEEAGSVAKVMSDLEASAAQAEREVMDHRVFKAAMEDENEALRNQLARYKMQILENQHQNQNTVKRATDLPNNDDGSVDSSHSAVVSHHLTLKAELLNLRRQLNEKDSELVDEKKKLTSEKSVRAKEEEQLRREIMSMKKSLKNSIPKTEGDSLKEEVKNLERQVQLHKEQLIESEDYVKTLESTMDKQLQMWQDEEDTFRKEVGTLREKSQRASDELVEHRTTRAQLKKLKQELLVAKKSVREMGSSKSSEVDEERKRAIHIERFAKEKAEEQSETIRNLREEVAELEDEVEHLTSAVEDQKEVSMSIDVESKSAIKKLKEQLHHATFRVQVFKNESPKRHRHRGETELEKTEKLVAKLSEQLRVAEQREIDAKEEKRLVEETFISQSDDNQRQAMQQEIDLLKQKLNETKARLRRIAVKSEEEVSKVRRQEEASRRRTLESEKELFQLKDKLQLHEQQSTEEAASRKQIENALREEITLLRKKTASLASDSPLSKSIKTHSNRIEKELQHLNDQLAELQKNTERVTKARRKISKDLLSKLVSNLIDLKTAASGVEVAAEQDKLQIENTFSEYESAVKSYDSELNDLKRKLKVAQDDLAEDQKLRRKDVKDAKQTEFDLIAKVNSFKVKTTNLQKEYDEFRAAHADSSSTTNQIPSGEKLKSASDAVIHECSAGPIEELPMRIKEDLSSTDLEQTLKMKPQDDHTQSDTEAKCKDVDSSIGASNKASETSREHKNAIMIDISSKKKLKTKLQHDPTRSDVEVKLRNEDSIGASMISSNSFESCEEAEDTLRKASAKDTANISPKKKWKMKLQHGPTRSDVEVKLREDDSIGTSMMNQSDLITSFRSMDRSITELNSKEEFNLSQRLDQDKTANQKESPSRGNALNITPDNEVSKSSNDSSIMLLASISMGNNSKDGLNESQNSSSNLNDSYVYSLQESSNDTEYFEDTSEEFEFSFSTGGNTSDSFSQKMDDSDDTNEYLNKTSSSSEDTSTSDDGIEVNLSMAANTIMDAKVLEKIEESALEAFDESTQLT